MKITDPLQEIDGILTRTDMQASVRARSVLWTFPPEPVETDQSAAPWWLWWNLLSLDAPAVAIVWAALFARASGAKLPASEAIALVLSVWVIYTSDRLLDGWTARNCAGLQFRHLFCDRHRFVLGASVVAASGLVLWLMTANSLAVEEIAGIKLGVIVVLYMAAIHASRSRLGWVLSKEISVGLLFTLGVTLPLWSRSVRFPWHEFLPWTFFGLLCFLNCLSIEFWENHRESSGWKQRPHPLVRWAAPRIDALAAALAVAALAACFLQQAAGTSQPALLAMCAAALLLLFLNLLRSKLSAAALRVLADLALFAPALAALLIRG